MSVGTWPTWPLSIGLTCSTACQKCHLSIASDVDTTLLEGTNLSGIWESEDPRFTFSVTDAGQRTDLSASLTSFGTEPPPHWRPFGTPTRRRTWPNGHPAAQASARGPWMRACLRPRHRSFRRRWPRDRSRRNAGTRGRTAPGNLSIASPATVVLGEALTVSGAWSFSPGEEGIASLVVLGPDGGQVAVKGTTMSTEVSVEHVVPASALVEGNHTVRLEVRDDVGNVAVPGNHRHGGRTRGRLW